MTFLRLFRRDCAYYRKAFLALAASAALISAILAGALLIPLQKVPLAPHRSAVEQRLNHRQAIEPRRYLRRVLNRGLLPNRRQRDFLENVTDRL